MFNVYTALRSIDIPSDVGYDVYYPEDGKSPFEQIMWVRENCGRDINVFTYSVYILNELNVLIAEGVLSRDNLRVYQFRRSDCGIIERLPLLGRVGDGSGHVYVDVFDFTDILYEQSAKYDEFVHVSGNNSTL